MSLPEPIYFGPAARLLSGWLHRPAAVAERNVGLVICNPFGYEAICAHRSIRHFAEHAARAGIPALRFDYDGAGNSAGDDLEPGRLKAWVGSIRSAAEALRASTGVERVCLLGIRLGALLATLAATELGDIDALIAIAPIVNGKGYLRELRMLQMAMNSADGAQPAEDDGALQSCGFVLSAETQTSLAGIDLVRLDTVPAPRMLIVDRAELPGGDAWARQLSNRGAQVEQISAAGYTEMMLDAHESLVPEGMIQTTLDWLATCALSASHAPNLSSPAKRGRTEVEARTRIDANVEETAVRFGGSPGLFGIVSAPSEPANSSRRAILLLNAGAVHHVGPNRLYVTLARQWARCGHVVLRMDISGLGDSAPHSGESENVVYPEHAVEDVRTAVQYLQNNWGATEVHALGVCSGGYHAFKAAGSGAPLAGVVLINPLTFFWHQGMSLKYPEHRVAADIMRYRTNALRVASWLKLLSGRVNLWELSQVLGRRILDTAREPFRALARLLNIPLRDDLKAELRRIANTGVDLQFIFAAQEPGLELLENKGGSTMRRLRARGLLTVHTIGDADHTFTDRSARETLIRLLLDRCFVHPITGSASP